MIAMRQRLTESIQVVTPWKLVCAVQNRMRRHAEMGARGQDCAV